MFLNCVHVTSGSWLPGLFSRPFKVSVVPVTPQWQRIYLSCHRIVVAAWPTGQNSGSMDDQFSRAGRREDSFPTSCENKDYLNSPVLAFSTHHTSHRSLSPARAGINTKISKKHINIFT